MTKFSGPSRVMRFDAYTFGRGKSTEAFVSGSIGCLIAD